MTSRARTIIDRLRAEHEAMGARRAKADALIEQLSGAKRVVLSGGPRTGKSTIAVRAGERYQRNVRHADGLIGKLDWSGMSDEVAKWIDADGDYIIEGVTAPRALRKWLAANPGKSLDITVVHFREPVQTQTDKQRAMSRGVETVWQQIRDELRARGANVIERETGPAVTERPKTDLSRIQLEPDEPEPEPETDEAPVIRNVR